MYRLLSDKQDQTEHILKHYFGWQRALLRATLQMLHRRGQLNFEGQVLNNHLWSIEIKPHSALSPAVALEGLSS